jgi:hypothetical protein
MPLSHRRPQFKGQWLAVAPVLILWTCQAEAAAAVTVHHAPSAAATSASPGCSGDTLEVVLDCWSGERNNLVIRWRPGSGAPSAVEEVWVLGGSEGSAPALQTSATPAEPAPAPAEFTLNRSTELDAPDRLDDRLAVILTAPEPARRADAVAALAISRGTSPRIRQALESALADADPAVRAQAVSVLARRFADSAAPALRQALADDQASVRLMAVDHAGSDRTLLAQALDDPDRIVRTLAERKLRELDAVPPP